MRRFLLSPRWLLGHALVVAAIVAFGWLGWWQWERAHAADGGSQNLGYALQWPLFAVFAVFAWWRVLKLELAKSAPVTRVPAPPREKREGPAVPRYQPPALADDPEDEELAAYNRRLAELNEQDRRKT